MKILLAVDSSAASEAAVTEVAGRPWPQGTTADVVTAVEVFAAWDAPGVADAMFEAADLSVRTAADRLNAAGIPSTAHVLTGDPRAMLVDYAVEWGADLVVLGSHDASVAVRFLLGSVGRAVVRHASCSVEIVRPRAGSGALKVMLATDGSESALDAAQSVAMRPWPARSEFRVISVVELVGTPYIAYLEPKAMEELRGQAMKHSEDAVAAVEQILADAGFNETGTEAVPAGSVKEVILAQAAEWGADMIVLGSHGRRGASRFLLGSVSEAVAFHAPCSVEIIRTRK